MRRNLIRLAKQAKLSPSSEASKILKNKYEDRINGIKLAIAIKRTRAYKDIEALKNMVDLVIQEGEKDNRRLAKTGKMGEPRW